MRSGIAFLSIVVLVFAAAAQPAKHRITFEGITYEPDTVYASVGDTIEWEGDFTSHPLSSESEASQRFPAAAPPFANDVGTLFQYVVTVAGEHAYYCVYHLAQGMVGTIFVAAAGVGEQAGNSAVTTSPNPASDNVEVAFSLEQPSDVRITVFDLQGRELMQTQGAYGAGENAIRLNVASIPAGIYYYHLRTSESTVVRRFTVVR